LDFVAGAPRNGFFDAASIQLQINKHAFEKTGYNFAVIDTVGATPGQVGQFTLPPGSFSLTGNPGYIFVPMKR
jgi:hypothetical protein